MKESKQGIVETVVISPKGREILIGDNQPVVLIGERINPFALKEAMKSGDMGPVRARRP